MMSTQQKMLHVNRHLFTYTLVQQTIKFHRFEAPFFISPSLGRITFQIDGEKYIQKKLAAPFMRRRRGRS